MLLNNLKKKQKISVGGYLLKKINLNKVQDFGRLQNVPTARRVYRDKGAIATHENDKILQIPRVFQHFLSFCMLCLPFMSLL